MATIGGSGMGVFITRRPNHAAVEDALTEAYQAGTMDAAQARSRAGARAPGVASEAASGASQVNVGRVIGAVVLFAVLYALAVVVDANNWISLDNEGRLYDAATTVLGVIVGFLGGEATGSSST